MKNPEITIYNYSIAGWKTQAVEYSIFVFHLISLSLPHQLEGRWRTWSVKKEAFPLVKWLPFLVVSFTRASKAKRHSNDPEV
jgi:hypothetical protein